jgi:hypothetical protein
METMLEAQTMDFPFVDELPKRERSKIATLWDRFNELREITEEKGMLLPVPFCASLLGISGQRVHQLLDAGKMERVEVDQAVFVTEKSLVEWARAEHKNGRPLKIPQTAKECLAVGREFVKAK